MCRFLEMSELQTLTQEKKNQCSSLSSEEIELERRKELTENQC